MKKNFTKENDIFPLPKQYPSSDWREDDLDSSEFLPEGSDILLPSFQRKEKTNKEKPKNIVSELNRLVLEKGKIINKELFKKYFGFQGLTDMQRELMYETKTTGKNKDFVNVIKSRLSDLEGEIENMFENKIEVEKPDKIVYIVERVLHFNRQNQEGQGLKILTPDQMLSRLPITLAQLTAGNNSKKLKNEIRQL